MIIPNNEQQKAIYELFDAFERLHEVGLRMVCASDDNPKLRIDVEFALGDAFSHYYDYWIEKIPLDER